MRKLSERAKVEQLLKAALEATQGNLDEVQITASILPQCERAKVAVRSWPTIFEAVKEIIRAGRAERKWFPSDRWPQKLLDAAVKDRFLFATK